jgi:hypothetical protein
MFKSRNKLIGVKLIRDNKLKKRILIVYILRSLKLFILLNRAI